MQQNEEIRFKKEDINFHPEDGMDYSPAERFKFAIQLSEAAAKFVNPENAADLSAGKFRLV